MGEVLWTLFMHTRCDLRASSGWPTASMRPIVHPSFGVAWLAYTRGTCHDQIARAARGRESFMHHAENSCGNKKPNHHLSTDRCWFPRLFLQIKIHTDSQVLDILSIVYFRFRCGSSFLRSDPKEKAHVDKRNRSLFGAEEHPSSRDMH